MIDYSYVECSSACITALAAFAAQYPSHRAAQIGTSIKAGGEFLKAIQRPDGSWCVLLLVLLLRVLLLLLRH